MNQSLLICTIILLTGFYAPLQAQIKSDLFNPAILKAQGQELSEKTTGPVTESDFRYVSDQAEYSSNSVVSSLQKNPGLALLSSALIPGSAQAANGRWVRAGIYLAVDAVGLIYHFDRMNTARRQEKAYEEFTHKNWSVMAYAQWLVKYSQANNLNNDWQALMTAIEGKSPDFSNTPNDWAKVNLALLHRIEKNTPFVRKGDTQADIATRANFSHELPKYGSQQYYELISKYYQFQPGWKDWYQTVTPTDPSNQAVYQYMWNGDDMPNALFYNGRDQAQAFNDNYRSAGNILKLMLVNHVVSAFDAYFTVKLKNSKLQADANLLRAEQFSLRWHF